MKPRRFVWIDDAESKIESHRQLIERSQTRTGNVSIESLIVNRDVLERLHDWVEHAVKEPPDLVIIDHVFAQRLPFDLKGSSVAHLLRNKLPEIPMICVTAMLDNANAFDQEDLSEYTTVIEYTRLERSIDLLNAIARDFRRLFPSATGRREHILEALNPPPRDRIDLGRVLPEEFLDHANPTTPHRIASWVLSVLLERPGFLYDRLNVATLLGLTVDGFERVAEGFAKALYRGSFHTDSSPRWWVSEIRRLLFELAGRDAPDTPQLAGRVLKGISQQDYSVCYVSRESEPPPDTVAFLDATRSAEQRAMRREFTTQHPLDTGTIPGFEARLVLSR